jgi:DNA repair exonuclease SbcCD ATPase subunit
MNGGSTYQSQSWKGSRVEKQCEWQAQEWINRGWQCWSESQDGTGWCDSQTAEPGGMAADQSPDSLRCEVRQLRDNLKSEIDDRRQVSMIIAAELDDLRLNLNKAISAVDKLQKRIDILEAEDDSLTAASSAGCTAMESWSQHEDFAGAATHSLKNYRADIDAVRSCIRGTKDERRQGVTLKYYGMKVDNSEQYSREKTRGNLSSVVQEPLAPRGL